MKKKDEIKVCLVGSSGGHLTHLYMLKPFWKDKNRFWVTFDKEDARSLLEGEKVYPCYFPTNRSIKALIKNTKIAWDVLHKEKPDLIISCGAAVAVPFFYIGKMMGAKLVYIEVFDRIDKPTMTGKMVYLSRFGRNYIEVGRYLERIFPVMRVRLIAVTDNYDSQSAWKTSDSIMVPMRNLLNDAYCRDISVKIKSQLAVKRKRGDFVGSFAAYGYRKDPANHTKLIVDELAAENVQSIFRWKISGMNNQGIANRLNIPLPDLSGQLENVQQSGNEIAKRGMPT